MNFFSRTVALSFSFFLVSACSDSGSDDSSSADLPTDTDLSIEAQIGPIEEVELGEIDPLLVAEGKKLFDLRCTACHQLESTVVGPPLNHILEIRSPVFVLNMILNPTEMLENHPDAKAMLEEFSVPMADLGISERDARAILEYLR